MSSLSSQTEDIAAIKAENQKLKLQIVKLKNDADMQSTTFKDLIQKLYKELQDTSKEFHDFKDKVNSERRHFEDREKELIKQKEVYENSASNGRTRIKKMKKLLDEMKLMYHMLEEQHKAGESGREKEAEKSATEGDAEEKEEKKEEKKIEPKEEKKEKKPKKSRKKSTDQPL